jgi:hypothetical protein
MSSLLFAILDLSPFSPSIASPFISANIITVVRGRFHQGEVDKCNLNLPPRSLTSPARHVFYLFFFLTQLYIYILSVVRRNFLTLLE